MRLLPITLTTVLSCALVAPAAAAHGHRADGVAWGEDAFAEAVFDDADALWLAQGQGEKRQKREKRGKRGKKGKHGKLSPEERAALKAEVQRKVQTFVTVELASNLKLDDQKALKLSSAVKAHGERQEAARQAAKAEFDALQQLIDSGAKDSALKAQIAKVRKAAQAVRGEGAFFDETARFLTVEEQARLVLAFPRVQREMRQMMRKARKGARGRGGRGGRGGDGKRGFDGLDDDF